MASEDSKEDSPRSYGISGDANPEAMLNLSLLDPPRWGWCAAGSIVDLLPPHERARRPWAREAYLKRISKQKDGKRKSNESFGASSSHVGVTIRRNSGINDSDAQPTSKLHSTGDRIITTAKEGETPVPETPHGASVASVGEAIANTNALTEGTTKLGVNPGGQKPQLSSTETQGSAPLHACHSGDSSQLGSGASLSTTSKTKSTVAPAGLDGAVSLNQSATEKGILGVAGANEAVRSNPPTKSEPKIIDVKAVDEDGILDMYSYHRGREGREPRDQETGELLCDVEQTDTNYEWGEPSLTATVLVSFPLSDGQNEGDIVDNDADQKLASAESPKGGDTAASPDVGCKSDAVEDTSTSRRRKLAVPQFRETVSWDLSDPNTPSAISFASGIAEEFGLDYGQTLDLSSSIQCQIDDFVRNNVTHNAPLSLKDPYGNDRGCAPLIPPGFAMSPQLYGHGAQGRVGSNIRGTSGKQRKGAPPRMTSGKSRSGERAPRIPPHLFPRQNGPPPARKVSRLSSTVSNGLQFTTEPEYREEVLRRAKLESTVEIERLSGSERDDGLVGVVRHERNYVCHICHARKPHSARFACGVPSHAFCENHCMTRLGFSIQEPDSTPVVLDYCPICCLSCVCPKCSRRLDAVAHELKKKALQQGTTAAETDFPDILCLCSSSKTQKNPGMPGIGPSSKKRQSARELVPENYDRNKATRKGGKSTGDLDRAKKVVPKVPVSEFPREVCRGRDLDPGTADDYRTLFSANGSFVVSQDIAEARERNSTSVSDHSEVEEDGSVDHCHVCRKHGNLLCCDRCPRAFHRECLDSSAVPDQDWECHVCGREKAGLPDDFVDGNASWDSMSASFVEFGYKERSLESKQVLCMIHEMVTKLMKYEFGELFRVPVDCAAVIGYRDIIKKPMDLGTIGSNLVNGIYLKRLGKDAELDDAVVAALQDIELVWHNCFTFNYKGSAIYRMAEVHRRRSCMIQKRSFSHRLSSSVKSRVDEYVRRCERERGVVSRDDSVQGESHFSRRPNGRNKIAVPWSPGGNSRTVAVLDPDSGMVVKMYRSMKGAGLAAKSLSDLGHEAEYGEISDQNVKAIIHRSAKDASEMLFGYRWLFLDDLRGGKVRFSNHALGRGQSSKPVVKNDLRHASHSGFVEMIDADGKCVFISVEEAVSYHALPQDVSIDDLRKKLLSHPLGKSFSFMGCSWRRWLPKHFMRENNSLDVAKESVEGDVDVALCLNSSYELSTVNRCFRKDGLESAFPPSVLIVKEDLISRRKLLGFETVSDAYQDWLSTREGTPGFPSVESSDAAYFQRYYLDGDRNIDGVVWRTLPKQILGPQPNHRNGIVTNTEKGSGAAKESCSGAPNLPAQRVSGRVEVSGSDRLAHTAAPCDTTSDASKQQLEHSSGEELMNGIVSQKQSPKLSSGKFATVAVDKVRKEDGLPKRDHVQKKRSSDERRHVESLGKNALSLSMGVAAGGEVATEPSQESLQSNGDNPSNSLGQQGVKRARNGGSAIDRDNRVAKKMAITSA